MSTTPPPRASFDSTTTTSTAQRPLIEQGGDAKPSSAGAKIKAMFKKTKEGQQPEEQDKKTAVPGSVKQGSFGGEASHMRMHM